MQSHEYDNKEVHVTYICKLCFPQICNIRHYRLHSDIFIHYINEKHVPFYTTCKCTRLQIIFQYYFITTAMWQSYLNSNHYNLTLQNHTGFSPDLALAESSIMFQKSISWSNLILLLSVRRDYKVYPGRVLNGADVLLFTTKKNIILLQN